MDHKNLAENWIEYERSPRNSDKAEKFIWAMLKERDLLYENPLEYFNFILEVLNQTDDEWVLTNLGAGPLESLLGHHMSRHGSL